jgi:hypothetical protein
MRRPYAAAVCCLLSSVCTSAICLPPCHASGSLESEIECLRSVGLYSCSTPRVFYPVEHS